MPHCSAKTGYDNPTGLGTPNAASLLAFLTGAATPATAPVVSSGSITGNVGVALSFAVTATAADAVSYTLSGAPAGMTINSGGAVAWASPVAGAYTVIVTATDTTARLSGQGTYKVTIAAAAPPSVTAASISGTAGVAISHQISVTSADTTTAGIVGRAQRRHVERFGPAQLEQSGSRVPTPPPSRRRIRSLH